MAQINLSEIRKIEKQKNSIHTKVFATYCVFESEGKRFLQIDTYGRADREMPEKISQSFQFDYETARFFVNLLSQEFDVR